MSASHLSAAPKDDTVQTDLLSLPENVFLALSVRKEALLTQLPVLSGLPPVTIQTQSGPGHFLFVTCDLIAQDMLISSSPQTQTRIRQHLTNLLLTTVLDALDLDLSTEGRRRHRQKHVRAYIESRLHEADLTPQLTAQAYGLPTGRIYLRLTGDRAPVSG